MSLSSVDKAEIVAAIQSTLEHTLAVMRDAALAAKEAATHEENKPENDKDTRSIELGYLAGAQAARGAEIERSLQQLAAMKGAAVAVLAADAPCDVGALVSVRDVRTKKVSHVFLAPAGAGLRVLSGGVDVQVITPESPLGDALMGRRLGDIAELENGAAIRELELLALR